MTKWLISLILVVGFGALFFLTYFLNKKTPEPEGCKSISEDCEACGITSCQLRKKGE